MPTRVPVTALIPEIREITASTTSALDQLTAIRDAMQPVGSRWRLGEFTVNGSSQVTALILEYGSMQLCLRATSTTQLLCSLHPEGGVSSSNIANPVTETGSTERSINAYTGGTNILTLTDRRIQIAELEGAISIFFRNTAGAWVAGIHAGIIYYPDNKNDGDRGFDGYGILIGRPGIWDNNTTNTTAAAYGRGLWLGRQFASTSEASLTGSVVRLPGNVWVDATFYGVANQFTTDANESIANPNDVDGNPRLQPVKISQRTFISANPWYQSAVGTLKFVRATANPPVQIADSDQFWSSNNFKQTATSGVLAFDIRNLVFVWNKNYPL